MVMKLRVAVAKANGEGDDMTMLIHNCSVSTKHLGLRAGPTVRRLRGSVRAPLQNHQSIHAKVELKVPKMMRREVVTADSHNRSAGTDK